MICHLQAGEPGKPVTMWFSSFPKAREWEAYGTRPGLSQKVQEPGAPMFEGRRMWLFSVQRERKFTLPSLCSIQPLNGLEDVHPHWRRPSFLLSLLIQRLISSGDRFLFTQETLNPVKLTPKINHHTSILSIVHDCWQYAEIHLLKAP